VNRDRAEQVLQYMLRPSVDECMDLWFGKSARTDREIASRFGVDVARAARGHFDRWAFDRRHPRRLVALVVLLDQFPRNVYRGSARMFAADAHCRALVKHALRAGAAERLRPIERVLLCLALTHSEALEDQQLCMAEWGRIAAGLAADDPLNIFDAVLRRHLAVIRRFGRFPHRNEVLQRASTAAEAAFLRDAAFRFDLPMVRQPDGTISFAGACGYEPSPAARRSAVSSSSPLPC